MHVQKYLIPLALCLSLCLPAYATETESDPVTTPETTVVDTTPEEAAEDETTPMEVPDYGSEDSGGDSGFYSGNDSGLLDDLDLVGVEVYGLSPVTPSDTTGLKSVLLEFIGEYDPVIVEYEYQNTNGYNSYLREVQPDYVWLASCGMLGLFVLSLFKLGGAILCRR